MSSSRKRHIKLLIRVAISCGLLVLVYRKVNLDVFVATLSKVSPLNGLSIILIYTLGQVLSARKWMVFVESAGMKRTFPEILRAYFFGMFINAFGLGTVGGDMARALAIHPEPGKRAASIATTIADRVQGLAVLLTIASVAVLFEQPPVLGAKALPIGILSILALTTGWILGPKLLIKLFPDGHRFGNAAIAVARAFPKDAASFWMAALISVCFHLLQIFLHVYIADLLNLGLSTGYIFATVPLVNIAASLPFSINGLGVRESMYVLLFTPAGVGHDAAVSMGAIWIVAVSINSLVGGFFLPRAERRQIEIEAEGQD